jgi:transcriptional regulator GlxA family with amidase domain
VITRLSDILFIQAVRAFLSTQEGQQIGWLRALKDPQVGHAMNLIHREAEFPWTVQSLGARVGMSRSVFADHFRSLVGESPLRYLARWRLNSAAVLLKTTNAKLAEVAQRIGYESEFTFSRAFKRATGFSPGVYRRSATEP